MPTVVSVGDVLAGKYRVEKVLGIGGMGMVVAAMHIELEQRVALKFMLPDAMRSQQAVDRFLREAKSAVRLRSEHICRVLDVGKLDDGAPYIVMEFMEGHDFAELISQRGPLPVVDTVSYVLQAIEGVAEAHANKIVHRDLKPANLFVTTANDGTPLVKVLDFGISKSAEGGATKTGDVMGSPAYMAPEQMRSSKDVDGRADVWALGVILYQAVTGRLPFEGVTLPELCVAIMCQDAPTLVTVRPDLPPAFSAVIMHCLEKDLARRIPDVGALAEALVMFGKPDAAQRAARINKVLRRSAGVITPLPGIAATIADTTGASFLPTPVPTVMETGVDVAEASAARSPIPTQVSTTLGGASGQLGRAAVAAALQTEPQPRRKRGVVIAVAGAVVAVGAVAGIIALSSSAKDTESSPKPTDVAGARTADASVAEPPPAPPAAVAVAPPDNRPERSKVTIRKTVDAFVEWSKAHATSPCPRTRELVTVAGDLQDGWGVPVQLTCTEQPEDVIAGVISAGPDRSFHTADDIQSWTLADITQLAGDRWQAKPKVVGTTRKTNTPKPSSGSGSGGPAGPPADTKPATTPPQDVPPPVTTPTSKPVATDKNGIPLKR